VSQENVEIVRAVTEAGKSPEAVERIGRGEFDLSFFLDPEIELDATGARDVFGDVPDIADVYRGEGVRTFWRRWYEAWRDVQFDVQDYLDAGDEVVVRWRIFPDHDSALKAVGLEE
jgi:hypothetical protein